MESSNKDFEEADKNQIEAGKEASEDALVPSAKRKLAIVKPLQAIVKLLEIWPYVTRDDDSDDISESEWNGKFFNLFTAYELGRPYKNMFIM